MIYMKNFASNVLVITRFMRVIHGLHGQSRAMTDLDKLEGSVG